MKSPLYILGLNVPRFGLTSFLNSCGVAVLAALCFLQSATISSAQIFNLTVPSTAPWFDTGINVTAGTLLNISASGTVTFGPSAGQTTGPDGGDNFTHTNFNPLTIYSNAIVVSLIGKIGGTTAVGTGDPLPAGIPGDGNGFVGSSYSETILESGRLFLGFNDENGGFNDNHGNFSVIVTVPEPATIGCFLIGLGVLACSRRFRQNKH